LIDLTIHEEQLERSVKRARERNILIPTFEQQKDPTRIPEKIIKELKGIGLWDLNPYNLFRITWKNEPKDAGGGFGRVNAMEIPPELSGVDARIIALVGKWFPTGAHKVGCCVPGPEVRQAIRSDLSQGGVAFHRKFLPRRGL
jgi:hypothetical protein